MDRMSGGKRYRYHVQLPLTGQIDQWWDVVVALAPESAAEVVRILLAQRDPAVQLVRISIEVDLGG